MTTSAQSQAQRHEIAESLRDLADAVEHSTRGWEIYYESRVDRNTERMEAAFREEQKLRGRLELALAQAIKAAGGRVVVSEYMSYFDAPLLMSERDETGNAIVYWVEER